jgi:uncharacterized protein YdhG (YjbR/CyaY superfamily)
MAAKKKRSSKTKPGPRPSGRRKASTRAKGKPKAVAKTIDAYIAALPGGQRRALQELRKIIRSVAPKAEECISYQIPAFRMNGRVFVWFGAAANHYAIYGVDTREAERKGYDTSGRGTVRFRLDETLPVPMVKRLVKDRLARSARKAVRPGV